MIPGQRSLKTLNDQEICLAGPPKTGCKKCFGRGYTGKDIKRGLYIPCRCTKPVLAPLLGEPEPEYTHVLNVQTGELYIKKEPDNGKPEASVSETADPENHSGSN